MLKLSLPAVSRGEASIREQVPPDDPMWEGTGLTLAEPLEVELTGRSVGTGVFVRGRIHTVLELPCRRCLTTTRQELDETVDLLFEELGEGEDEDEFQGEVYVLPAKGMDLDLTDAIREQVLLHVPQYVLCREECRGLCPRCGADRNEAPCDCAPEEEPSAWDALKKIKFD